MVNNTNIPYAQQLLVTAMGGPTYTYAGKNMCSQLQNPYTPFQAAYP